MNRVLRHPHPRGRKLAAALAVALAGALVGAAWAQAPGGHYLATAGGYAGPSQLTAGWNPISLEDGLTVPVGMQLFRVMGSPTDEQLIKAIAAVVASENSPAEAANDATLLAMAQPAGGPTAVPGHPGTAWVKLEPGRYVVASTDAGSDQRPLVQRGLFAHLTVTAGDTGQTPPDASYEAKLVDFDIELPTQILAGPHVWRIRNQGAEVHHMLVFQLASGKTPADVRSWLEGTPGRPGEQGPPPGQFVAGTSVLSPGDEEVVPIALAAGNYVAMCFMTDPITHKPHVMLGMFVPFSVAAQTASR